MDECHFHWLDDDLIRASFHRADDQTCPVRSYSPVDVPRPVGDTLPVPANPKGQHFYA